jgi:hypothetical protein
MLKLHAINSLLIFQLLLSQQCPKSFLNASLFHAQVHTPSLKDIQVFTSIIHELNTIHCRDHCRHCRKCFNIHSVVIHPQSLTQYILIHYLRSYSLLTHTDCHLSCSFTDFTHLLTLTYKYNQCGEAVLRGADIFAVRTHWCIRIHCVQSLEY